MNMPRVSVIMPLKNAARYVEEAVHAVLAQDSADVELLVVDDGSTDGSRAVLERIGDARLRVLDGPQAGIAQAVNCGLNAANGEIIARCDADDAFPPGRLAWQVGWLMAHAEFGAVCGGFSAMDDDGRFVKDMAAQTSAEEITAELRRGHARTHACTFAIRADLLRQLGGWREWFHVGEDLDLQFRLANLCRVWYEPKCAYRYRLHDTSITHQQASSQRLFFQECATRFAQQRAETGQDDLERGSPPVVPAAVHARHGANEHIQNLLSGQAWNHHRNGERWQAVRVGLAACRRRPGNLAAWRSLLALIVKRSPRQAQGGAEQ